MKLNLGCGKNLLPGWENHDVGVDISKPLPWPDNSADFIFCEHCVEHIEYYAALRFFAECHRILKPDGVIRISVPSLEQITFCNNPEYFKFTTQFHDRGANARGAMHSILFCFGHKAPWTAGLLHCSLYYAGFEDIEGCRPHESRHDALRNVEGHHKIIGDAWNNLESVVAEGTARKVRVVHVVPIKSSKTAIVVGGSENALADYERAAALCAAAGVDHITLVSNDMIEQFPHAAEHFVTLHPDKLPRWLSKRKAANFPMTHKIWAHRQHPSGTLYTSDWGGSVGLFMVKIAKHELQCDRVILCGIPMDPDAKHFVRHLRWSACVGFRRAWETRQKEIAPLVRSLSGGWTEQTFGAPDSNWLTEARAAAA